MTFSMRDSWNEVADSDDSLESAEVMNDASSVDGSSVASDIAGQGAPAVLSDLELYEEYL